MLVGARDHGGPAGIYSGAAYLGGPGGREELVIGAPGFGDLRGKAYVFAPDNDTGLLYSLSGRPAVDEPVPADAFGYRVRGIGDVDGDGDSDLAVAAPFCLERFCRVCLERFCRGKGKVYLYSGDASMDARGHRPAPRTRRSYSMRALAQEKLLPQRS